MTKNPQERSGRGAVVLLLTGATVSVLAVLFVYGMASEYGNPRASTSDLVRDTLVGAALVILAVLALLGVAAWRAPRRSWVRPVAGVLALATVVGLPAAQVLGVEAKYDRYRAVPDCVGEFSSGPAVPVVEAAQAAYEEIEHPGRFGGGGSSGVDGCETGLTVRGNGDVAAAYRDQLPQLGWTVTIDSEDLLRAERDGQEIEVRPDEGGARIWIGPAGLRPRQLEEGEVGPRG